MATILIADDDAATRLLVRTVLEYAGHEVVDAADGKAALEIAARVRPDLILLDLSLPILNGTELLRALRADPTTKGILVALYTATPINAALQDFMEIYGVAGAVAKPSEPQGLMDDVERLLRRT